MSEREIIFEYVSEGILPCKKPEEPSPPAPITADDEAKRAAQAEEDARQQIDRP